MKLRFTPRATANLVEIADHIHAHNPAAAQRVRAAIYESLQNLILFPHAGRRQKAESVRKFVTRRAGRPKRRTSSSQPSSRFLLAPPEAIARLKPMLRNWADVYDPKLCSARSVGSTPTCAPFF
jgi:plasmid stabilization system protein ParE